MPTIIQEQKRELRTRVLAAVNEISPEARERGSAQVCAQLQEQELWMAAKSALLFAPMPGELDIWPLVTEALARGCEVLLPRFSAGSRDYEACHITNAQADVRVGYFGIREPSADCARTKLSAVDLILVPGVAFDRQGHRLGRGKGYYDRLLKTVRGLKCGVGFDEQLVEEIPVEAHDVRLDFVVTPSRWMGRRG